MYTNLQLEVLTKDSFIYVMYYYTGGHLFFAKQL